MAKAKGSVSKTIVWIILALLIVGLMGFGTTSFSGRVTNIGTVGTSAISASSYSRALQNEINALQAQAGQQISFQQAQALGLDQRVLAQMVVSAALEHEADAMTLSIGDERLAQELQSIPAFRGSDGAFNRDAYAFTLRNAGLSEAEFEADLRDESASTVLQGAVLAGTTLPDTYINTLVSFAGERRDFTWARLGPEALITGIDEPSEAELTEWYEANIAAFTLPETKVITYAALTPEMILDTVEVDEASLREAYAEQEAQYNQPERRLVERLVFADEAEATTAKTRLESGEATFEELVEERGLALEDTDMGDVSLSDLGAAGDLVFAAETGAIAGPAPTDLGPALFRINAVLAAQQTSFEDAQEDLRVQLALDRARRVIETQAQGFDDELAAGATLEELADTTDMQLGTINWTGENAEDMAAYEEFRAAATAVSEGDFPQIENLGDGGIFALRLDEIRAPAPQPFEDVADAVRAGWELEARTEALVQDAEILRSKLAEGGTFEGSNLAPTVETGLTRNAFANGLPQNVLIEVFAQSVGDVSVVPDEGAALIVRLDAITPVDLESEESQALAQAFGDRAAADVAQDLFRALATDIQTRAGVEIDQQAINAVHVNFQ